MRKGGGFVISVTDCRMEKRAAEKLLELGFRNISLKPWAALPDGIASHPDMLFFVLDDTFLTHIDYYQYNKIVIDEIVGTAKLKLVTTDEAVGNKYPADVLFNAAVVGNYLIANLNFVSKKILVMAEEKGLKRIHIKQGYAKCSICAVSGGAVITSDEGVFETLKKETDLNVLKIEKGHIELCQYDHGFIGGASGGFGDKIFFNGDLNFHPDGERIIEFCKRNGKTAVCLTDKPLSDVGTIFLLP